MYLRKQTFACTLRLSTAAILLLTATAAGAQNSDAGTDNSSPSSNSSGEKGLGSFIKQELRSRLNTGAQYQHNNYPYGNYHPGNYNYQGQYQNVHQNVQGYNSYSSQQQPVQYIRQPDGSMKSYGANGMEGASVQMPQSTPHINGDLVGFVTSNMPVDVSGGVESLIPKELHDKAYGPQLTRFAPLNGAEGYYQPGF